jgi:hypothetical protein
MDGDAAAGAAPSPAPPPVVASSATDPGPPATASTRRVKKMGDGPSTVKGNWTPEEDERLRR